MQTFRKLPIRSPNSPATNQFSHSSTIRQCFRIRLQSALDHKRFGESLSDSNPGRRAELTVAALDAVAAYDWGTVARNVLSVYETVVLGRSTVDIVQ